MTLLSVQPKDVCGETDDEIIGFWAVDNLLCLVVLCVCVMISAAHLYCYSLSRLNMVMRC